jgi:hypothetical protein
MHTMPPVKLCGMRHFEAEKVFHCEKISETLLPLAVEKIYIIKHSSQKLKWPCFEFCFYTNKSAPQPKLRSKLDDNLCMLRRSQIPRKRPRAGDNFAIKKNQWCLTVRMSTLDGMTHNMHLCTITAERLCVVAEHNKCHCNSLSLLLSSSRIISNVPASAHDAIKYKILVNEICAETIR